MQLSEAIEKFADSLSSRSTASSYKSDLRQFLHWLAGQGGSGYDSITKMTPQNIRGYLATLIDQRATNTRHRKLAAFRRFAKWGLLSALWPTDPTLRVESIRKHKTLPRPFAQDETARIWAVPLDATQNALRSVLFYAGLRATACVRLRVKDVTVTPPQIRYKAKGGRERVVPMHPALKDILWDYIASHTDLKGEAYIFRQKHGPPLTRRQLANLTKRWGTTAKVADCTPHRFRHAFGTELLRKTKNLRAVQEALGHESIETTAIYTQVLAEETEAAVAQLFWPVTPPTVPHNPESSVS